MVVVESDVADLEGDLLGLDETTPLTSCVDLLDVLSGDDADDVLLLVLLSVTTADVVEVDGCIVI